MRDFLLETEPLEDTLQTEIQEELNAKIRGVTPGPSIPNAQPVARVPAFEPQPEPRDFLSESLDLNDHVEEAEVTRSLETALQEPAGQAAKLDRLSRESGLPAWMVEQNPEEAERLVKIERAREVLTHAPVLRNKLREPSFARAIQDEIEGLSFWETVFRDATVGLDRGQATRELGILGSRLRAGEDVGAAIKELEEQIPTLRGSRGFIEAAANAIGTFVEGIPEVIAKGEAGAVGAGTAAAIAGQAGPQAALPEEIITVPGAAAIGFTAAAGSEVFRQSAIVEGGLIFNDLIREGVDPEIAGPVSEVAGMINGVLEVVSAGIIAAPIKNAVTKFIRKRITSQLKRATKAQAVKNLATGLASVIAKETTTEILQETTSVAAGETAQAIDPNAPGSRFSTEEGVQEVIDQFQEVFVETIKAMTVIGLPGATLNFVADTRAAAKAEQNIRIMEAVGAQAQESEVLQQTPELFQEYVKEALEDGPVTEIYIDAREFQGYFQELGLNPAEIVEELPETRNQYETALEAGQDLRIPLDEYTAKIAGTEHHAALLRHARFDPSQEMTLNEAEQFRANEQERFGAEADRALDEALQTSEFEASANQVFESVKQQLVESQRVNEEAAAQFAELHKAFAKTQARRLGITPAEVYQRLGLKIQGAPLAGEGVLTQSQEFLKDKEFRERFRTPEFRKFFEGSKVVDDQGDPLVVFHGTDADISAFKKPDENRMSARAQAGFFFTPDIQEAKRFGKNTESVFLSIRNPRRITEKALDELFASVPKIKAIETLKKGGHDGLIIEAIEEDRITERKKQAAQFVAFDPSQIKSIFNRGTFDPNDPRILFQGSLEPGTVIRNPLRTVQGEMVAPGKGELNPPGKIRVRNESGDLVEINDFEWQPDPEEKNFGLPERPVTIPAGDPLLTPTHELKGREKIHGDIEKQIFGQVKPVPGGKPVVYIMGGGAASGKGSVVRQLRQAGVFPSHDEAVVIDADDIKLLIPEYKKILDRGDHRAAEITHEESSQLARRFEKQAMANKMDMVVDRTLGASDKEKIKKQIQTFKTAGYEVKIIGVSVDTAEAVIRAETRASQNGRYVPISRLMSAHINFSKNHADFAAIADSFSLYDNMGRLPVEIAKKGKGGIEIIREKEYTGFTGKKKGNNDAQTLQQIQPADPQKLQPERDVEGPGKRDAGELPKNQVEEDRRRAGSPQEEETGDQGRVDPSQAGQDPDTLTQKRKKGARGSIQFIEDLDLGDKAIISLLENADLSTFLHETGHFFFESLRGFANEQTSPSEIAQDMKGLLDFVGVKDMETWNSMSFEERRAGHEKVADAFEAYLFEGKAPSFELKEAFRRFRTWLIQVYRSIRGLNVSLNDDVRGIFDRLVATEEQIEEVRRQQNFQPIFENRGQAGLSEREWAEYQALADSDDARAQEELGTKSLRNMQWLSRAKSRVLRQLQRENRDKRKGVQAEAAEQVANLPVYKAKRWLRGPVKKVETPKSNPNKVEPTIDSLFAAIAKLGGLDKEEVVRLWGVDPADKFSSGVFGKPVLRKKNGLDPDRMAEALAVEGYINRDEQGKVDITDLEDKFFDEAAGNKRFSVQNEEHRIAEDLESFNTEQEKQFLDVEIIQHGKLDLPILEEIYGSGEDAIWRQLGRGRFGMVAEEGYHPDFIATYFGFTSGDEMIQALAAAPPLREAVELETDRRMLELFGDLNDPETLENAVNEALHNQARTRMVHTELRALSKKVGGGNFLLKAAREWAKVRIARIKFRDLKPKQYLAAEKKASRKALEALRKGDLNEAANHKKAEVLNHHFSKEAFAVKEEVEKAVRYFKRFDRPGTRKNLDVEYLEQIDNLLDRYGFQKSLSLKEIDRRKSLREWIRDQEEKGLEPVIDEKFFEDLNRRHYKDVPVEEIMGLRDAVKNIEHLGRLKNKLLLAKRKRELEAAVGLMAETIEKNSKGRRKKEIETHLPKDELAKTVNSYFASHRKLSSLVRQMDGFKDGGPVWELIMEPLNEKSNLEAIEREKATKRLAEIFSMYSTADLRGMYKKEFFPSIKDSLTKMGRLTLALNWGNEDNRQRIMGGYGWEPGQIRQVLDTLDERDWQFVQSVWDYINEFWPEIEAKEKRITGVAPEKVEASPIETRFGEIAGGYYPIKFDTRQDVKAYADAAREVSDQINKGRYTRSTTRRGHTKARVEQVNRPVRLDFGVIFEHVEQVIHDLAFHEYLVDANRLLRHEGVRNSILDHYGFEVFKAMQNTLTDVAAGDIPGQNGFERALNWIRTGSSIAAMGWNFGTAILQPLGLTISMSRIGPKWVAKGIARWVRDAVHMEGSVRWIHDRSDMMRLRSKTLQREINEIRNKVTDQSVRRRILGPAEDSFFWMIAKAQMIADVPTWLGQYEKSMAAGENESRAIALADQAVLDSQGGGQVKDLAGIQRGGPLMRIWTNFYSYFNVVWNNSAEAFARARFNDPVSIGRLAADMFFIMTLPAVLEFALREALIKGKCEQGTDLECMAGEMAKAQIHYAGGTLVGVRDVAGGLAGFSGYEGPAGTRGLAELSRLGVQAQQGEIDKAFLKALNNSAGILLHYPAGQVQKTVEGFTAISEGKTDSPQALFFGEPKTGTR